jgi:hypothetical protein
MPNEKAASKKEAEPQTAKGDKNPVATKRKTFDELLESETFQKFIQIKSVIDNFSTTGELDDEAKSDFVTQYERWMKAGQPKPQMPNLSGVVVPVITSIYRTKSLGKQKIYAYLSDGTKKGLEETPIMQKVIDQKTGNEVETNIPTGELKVRYTIDYTKVIGEAMVEEALKTADNPEKIGFYIRDGGRKIALSPTDFNDDYDQLLRKYRATQQVSL